MTFGSPWFLLGALGAGIPVLLHLYGRRRARRVPFPSLMLLRRAERERSSLLRLRQLWLMLLRALLIILLSLALSQPVIRGLRLPGLPGTPVVCLLDNSLSLRAGQPTGGEPAGLKALQTFQAQLPAAQEFGYGLLPAPPGTAPLELARGRRLPAGLQQLPSPPSGPVDLAAALDAAVPLLAAARLQDARLVLLTDLQASAWRSAVTGLPNGRDLLIIDCGAGGPNAAVTGLEVVEPPALVGRPLRLRVTVQQWPPSATPVTLPVRVTINNGALPTAPCRLVRGRGEVLVEWTPSQPGPLTVKASLPRDRLAADNEATLGLTARPQLRVGLLGATAGLRWLRLALSPLGAGPVRVNDVPITGPLQADALVVNGATVIPGLPGYVAGGGGLLLFAPELAADTLRAFGDRGTLQLGAREKLAAPVHLGSFDSFQPPLRAFANAAAGDLQAPEFREYRALTVPPGSPWQVLARFSDETPALLGLRWGTGRVLLANFSPEMGASTLPTEPVVVPLLHRLVAYLARADAGDTPAVCADPLESDLQRLSPTALAQRLRPLRATVCRPEEAAARLPAAVSLATPCWFLALTLLGVELLLLAAGLAPRRATPGTRES